MEDFLSAFQVGYDRTLVEQTHAHREKPAGRRAKRLVIAASVLAALAVGAGTTALLMRGGKGAATPGTGTGTAPEVKRPLARTAAEAASEAAELIAQALKAEQAPRRRAAVEALSDLRRKASLPELRAAVADRDPDVSRAAVIALGRLDDKSSAQLLRKLLVESLDFKKLHVAGALALMGDPQGIKHLREQLQGTSQLDKLRQPTALEYLGEIKDRQAAEWRRFIGPVSSKRIRGLGYLAALGEREAAHKLEALLTGDNPTSRVEAARVIVTLQLEALKEARQTLVDLLDLQSEPERVEAAATLVELASGERREEVDEKTGARSLDLLVQSLRSGTTATRRRAAIAIGRFGRPRDRDALVGLLRDAAPEVALAAAAGLMKP